MRSALHEALHTSWSVFVRCWARAPTRGRNHDARLRWDGPPRRENNHDGRPGGTGQEEEEEEEEEEEKEEEEEEEELPQRSIQNK